jgi:DNA-directed RNA polymerase subunit M/transcription elongation factor TFIIS
MENLFCKKCGKIRDLKTTNCTCGEISDTESVSFKQNFKKIEEGKGAIKDENQLATYEKTCKKCGYGFAQILDLGIWYSDEAGVIRYKCGKCGNVEQDNQSNT